MLSRRGFTLTELLVALALGGIVATAIGRVLIHTHRLAQRLAQRIELNHNLRSAVAILPVDLRELDATDPAGSDIIDMTVSSLRYKAMRGFYMTCLPASGSRVSLDTAAMGSRPLDPEYDSLLIFSDGQTLLAGDDRWVHVDLTAATLGRNCPGGAPSLDATIRPGLAGPDSVLAGSPVRSFEVTQVRRYADAAGVTWVGARRFSKVTGWTALQPVAGPLGPGGLRFTYFAREGAPTRDPARVARIGIMVTGRTSLPVWLGSGKPRYLADSLATQVALRNNR
ncbi:MAG: prepilin-type N-terminal cleavage/methylation domain-containing protein [Gemmatimonadetes bacterium]|nr:prepilin-type N-terminal cleavage/methylation domain-containing protein [Gemmatimonadota bacterium]